MFLIARDEKGASRGVIEVKPEVQTIGRSVNCALTIVGPGVSRIHASVYLHEKGVVVNDEGSANGVKVDGRAITGPTLVDPTNAIKISGFALRLQDEPPTTPGGEPDDVPEERDTRLEANSPSPTAPAHSAMLLLGRGGPYDGTTLKVEKVLSTVGRDDDNEVVLEDPSISRRHAQLRLSPGGDHLTVLDLRSSNGTFLDGQRIKRAEVAIGAVLRFGDLAFKVSRERVEQEAKGKGASPQRKRLLFALGVGGLLTAGLIAAALMVPPEKPPPRPVSPEELLRKRQARLQAIVDAARRDVAKRAWSAAIIKIDDVLKNDPLNQKAKQLRAQALDELGHSKTFEKGERYFALGNRENLIKAREYFARVPATSIYARETKYKLRTINERIAEEYRIDGVSYCKARYFAKCYRSLCKYFALMPQDVAVAGEPGLRRRMAAVEKRFRRRKTFKKCTAKRYLGGGQEQRQDDPQEVLSERYKVLAIREAITLYYQGKIDVAIKQVARLRTKRAMRPHVTMLEDVNRQLLIVRGKYQEAFSFIRQRKASQADREVRQLLSADKRLIPSKLISFYQRDTKRALGSLYADLGSEEFKVKSYAAAFRHWKRGVEVAPSSERALNGLLLLEKVAERLIGEGRGLAKAGQLGRARQKLTLARDICREGKAQRKEAIAALAQFGK